ncbi:MAG: hypothetical protein Q9178_007877 [Gyalolechia marmorata]
MVVTIKKIDIQTEVDNLQRFIETRTTLTSSIRSASDLDQIISKKIFQLTNSILDGHSPLTTSADAASNESLVLVKLSQIQATLMNFNFDPAAGEGLMNAVIRSISRENKIQSKVFPEHEWSIPVVKYTIKSLIYISNPPHRYLELAKGLKIGTLFRLFGCAVDQHQLNSCLGFDGSCIESMHWCRATNIVVVTDSTDKRDKATFIELRHVRDAYKLLEMLKRSYSSERRIGVLTIDQMHSAYLNRSQ